MNNRLLRVELSGNKISEEAISEELLKDFIGGRGLGVKLFIDRVEPKMDPLSSKNPLIFTTGPLTGTTVPCNGRFSLVTKSPLTGTLFYSNSGGFFAPFLKKCGFDGIIIEGASAKPQYLVVDGEQASLKDASILWGLDTEETMKKLQELEGKNVHVLLIGPAGENLVRYASIMNDAERAFGRGGVGAVMGSKKLKAIVVKGGKKKTEVKDPERLSTIVHSALEKIKVAPITRSALPTFGTSGMVNIINELGMLPINNFQKGFDERSENVSGESIRHQIFVKDEGCFACPMRCGRLTKAGDMEGKGPEYESVWALGPNLGVYDLITVAQTNYMCNKMGLDTISAGVTISCAMELQEKGLLKDSSLKFGNGAILKDLILMISKKEGIGKELAEGSKRLAEKYKSSESSIQVKGLELPAYDPRGAMGHALGYATSNRGGCHLTGYLAAMEIYAAPKKINRVTVGGKADLLALKQNQSAVEDSLVVCKFVGWGLGFDFQARFLTSITGIEYSVADLVHIGERIYNLERLFNNREGFGKKDDTLPIRFINTPLTEGFSKDMLVPIENMLKEYYKVRGWNDNGVPTEDTLKKLGIKAL